MATESKFLYLTADGYYVWAPLPTVEAVAFYWGAE